jgi:molybdate transport system substrate-binding protein
MKHMKKIGIVIAMFLAVGLTAGAQKVRVAAAANLRYVLEDIRKQYEKEYPKTTVDITFGASGALTQQILNGATYDLFMAADMDFPNALKAKGATVGPVMTYIYGKVVMWSRLVSLDKGLNAVLSPDVRKVAIANPKTAPYGENAVATLKKYGLYDKIVGKIVWGENISQTAQFAFTGNAEIGFIALSLALAPDMRNKGHYYELPADICPLIAQGCVLIKGWKRNGEASRFMKYVLSPKCNAIWESYGYGLVKR